MKALFAPTKWWVNTGEEFASCPQGSSYNDIVVDTKTVAQLFIPYSKRVSKHRETGKDRKAYNIFVCNRVLHMNKVSKKLKNAGGATTRWIPLSCIPG